MTDHAADRYIENYWIPELPLVSTVGRPELRPMVPALPGDHLLVRPELCQDSLHIQARHVTLQVLKYAAAA